MIKVLLLSVILLVASCDLNKNIIGLDTRFGLGCDLEDNTPPTSMEELKEVRIAAVTRSPEYSWTAAEDFCGLDRYEWAIGTTPGGEELVAFKNIGTQPQFRDTGLALDPSATYYTSVRAYDINDNVTETITSNGWQQLDPVNDLPNLIVRLDSNALSSIVDGSGNPATSGAFSGGVQNWNDTSFGGSTHNFFAVSAASRPDYNPAGYMEFNGINDALTVLDHDELNTGTVDQRNFSAVFETSSDISSRQIIYDEGANIRGMNFYIEGGQFYCSFYNTVDDGDGIQPFTFVSAPISTNTKYIATWVFDYTNYTGPSGPDASLSCYLNNTLIGTTTSTSKLFAHSGDIGIGAEVNGSHYVDGPSSGDGKHFNGKLFEFMIINGVPTSIDLNVIYEYLSDKWSVP